MKGKERKGNGTKRKSDWGSTIADIPNLLFSHSSLLLAVSIWSP